MITLNRLHGAGTVVVNADLIETVEARPDTVITLITRRKFVVENSVEDVISQIIDYHQQTVGGASGTIRIAMDLEHLDDFIDDDRNNRAA